MKYKVYWSYAMSIRNDQGEAIDPRRSGGEVIVEADTWQQANEVVRLRLKQRGYTQPWDETLLTLKALRAITDSITWHDAVMALSTLSDEHLTELLTEVRAIRE